MFKDQKRDKLIYLILENIEYARNVAGIFRTADAAGVKRIYLTGITKTPPFGKDLRKASRNKEASVEWCKGDTGKIIHTLKKQGFRIVAIELTDKSIPMDTLDRTLQRENKICFIAGSEVYGIVKDTLAKCDLATHIPMYGKGASLNVGTSIGIVLYSI